MRKIAFLLLMFFATVQLALAITVFFSEISTVFIDNDEKGEDKGNNNDKTEKKDFDPFLSRSANLTHEINTAFHLADKIHPSPILEKLTPPPNFF